MGLQGFRAIGARLVRCGGYSMTDTESQPVHEKSIEVCIDIACPDCEYNLRGLPGPIVNCPECGLSTDVPVLAARQWDKPWYRAPGFNTIMWPAALFMISWFVGPIVSGMLGPDQAATYSAMLLALVLWVWLMIRAARLLGGPIGFGLALLSHMLVVGYLIGLIGVIWAVIITVLALINQEVNVLAAVYVSLALAVFLLIIWGCRRVERAIAGVCIRHHLRRKPTN